MKLFKKTFSIYVILTILGMVCIGLGCGISVFELSNYKMADYHTNLLDSNLPQIKTSTVELEAKLDSPDEPFYLDATDWYFEGGYDVQYDNNLKDKVLIEVTAPEDIYDIALEKEGSNYYYLHCAPDEFSLIRFSLALAKEGYIPENYPQANVKLTMSEAQAKAFKMNEMRYKTEDLEQQYRLEQREQMMEAQAEYQQQLQNLQDEHSQQIQNLQQQYSDQIVNLRTQHSDEITNLQEQHLDEIRQKNEQIQHLQGQLYELQNT